MKKTTNYNLPLYEVNDIANLTDGYNAAMNLLDSDIKTVSDSVAAKATAADLNSEITRAKSAESTLTTNLNSEITRAKSAESTLTTNLNSEITRAKSAESTLTTNLNSEITRAKSAESTNESYNNGFCYPFYEMSKINDYGYGKIPSAGIQGLAGDKNYFYLGVNDDSSDLSSTIYRINKTTHAVEAHKINYAQHNNSMCCVNGYLYICANVGEKSNNYGILKVSTSDFSVVKYISTQSSGICSDGTYLYMMGTTYLYKCDLNLNNVTIVKKYDDIYSKVWQSAIAQGCEFYENKILFIQSYSSAAAYDTTLIRVTDINGNVLNEISLGFYGEFEDLYYDQSLDRMFFSFNGFGDTGGIGIWDITKTPYLNILTRNYLKTANQYSFQESQSENSWYYDFVIDYNSSQPFFEKSFKSFAGAISFAMQNKTIQTFFIISKEPEIKSILSHDFSSNIPLVTIASPTTEPTVYYPYKVDNLSVKNCTVFNNRCFNFNTARFEGTTFKRYKEDANIPMFYQAECINLYLGWCLLDYSYAGGFVLSNRASDIFMWGCTFKGDPNVTYTNWGTDYAKNCISQDGFENYKIGIGKCPFRRHQGLVFAEPTGEGLFADSNGTYIGYRTTGGGAVILKSTNSGLSVYKTLTDSTSVKIDASGNITVS